VQVLAKHDQTDLIALSCSCSHLMFKSGEKRHCGQEAQFRSHVSEPKRRTDGYGKPVESRNLASAQPLWRLRKTQRGMSQTSQGGNGSPDHEFERDKMLPEWHGWHAARRGLRTNLYRLEVPEKTIQAILRHANVSTTNTYYIKSAAEDTRVAMAKLEKLVIGNAEATNVLGGNEVATLEAEVPTALVQ
jgi:hypothetical protein